jgi:hypothetical protein
MTMRTCSQRIHALLAGVLAVVLSIHFGLTLIYLLPLNPITLRLAPLLDRYMTPFFAQNWRLFAPEPISETRILLLSCRLRQRNGRLIETAWADISTPLWEVQARQRFSPASWLARLQMHALQRFFAPGEPLFGLKPSQLEENPELHSLKAQLQAAEQARHAFAARVLARLGSAYCDRRYGAGLTVATGMRLAVLHVPPFSQRHKRDDPDEWRVYPVAWMSYERVAPLTDMEW